MTNKWGRWVALYHLSIVVFVIVLIGTGADYLRDLGDRIAYDSIDDDDGVAHGLKVQRIKQGYGKDNLYFDQSSPSAGICIARSDGDEIVVHKFGNNIDVDTADEDIWDGGGTWAAPTTARTHQIVSTDTDDDGAPAGNGAQTVQVYGLNANYELADETVTMNGTTNVATSSTYTMIYRLIVRAAGSTGSNEGVITATADTDSTVTAQIAIGNNQTLMCIYQIPVDYKGYLHSFYATTNKANQGNADIKLWVKPFGEVWQLKNIQAIASAGSSRLHHKYIVPVSYSEKTLVKMVADSAAVNNDISAGFDLVLISTIDD